MAAVSARELLDALVAVAPDAPPIDFQAGVTGLGDPAHGPAALASAVAAARGGGFLLRAEHAGVWDGAMHRGQLGEPPGALSVRFVLFKCGQCYLGIDGEDAGAAAWVGCDVDSQGTWTWEDGCVVMSLFGLDGVARVRDGNDAAALPEELRVRGPPTGVRVSPEALAGNFVDEAWGADAGSSGGESEGAPD